MPDCVRGMTIGHYQHQDLCRNQRRHKLLEKGDVLLRIERMVISPGRGSAIVTIENFMGIQGNNTQAAVKRLLVMIIGGYHNVLPYS